LIREDVCVCNEISDLNFVFCGLWLKLLAMVS